ncbi:ankyrin repeat protein [Legionella massiliensis]|uniref:Ankyrin repeat protein n=1 Tax=Legionella massiliensis TaxID=1034943 RepID=A0A078L1H4_9GAMM|nr:ankyrin repeat domain-containing protein [Legionella massiliensis]CDZ79056.1 ankyrin repeat protein [Legionella massiliensis]CEE14794.1 Ankyrin repeats (3 copies) [Legionella massiliensis]
MTIANLSRKIYKHLDQLKSEHNFWNVAELQAEALILNHCLEQLETYPDTTEKRNLSKRVNAGLELIKRRAPENLGDFSPILLLQAIENSDTELLIALIALRPEVVSQPIVDQESVLKTKTNALILAATKGRIEVAKLLLKVKGLDINFGMRRTALDEATAAGNLEMVQLLVEAGAKPTQASFQIACSKGYLQIARELVEANKQSEAPFDYNQALMLTITQGKMETIRYLVNELGADVNFVEPPIFSTNSGDLTPLIIAIQYKQSEAASFLIGAGANVDDAKAHFAMTALGFAAFIGDAISVENILAESLDEINARDKEGCTPLMRAVQNDNPGLVKQLLDAGANVNLRQKNGNTALIDAVRMRSRAVVDILLTQDNLELEATDKEKYYTAREIAFANNDKAIVQAIDQFTSKREEREIKQQMKSELDDIIEQYLDHRTNQVDDQGKTKEYLRYYISGFFQKSFSQKKDAVNILQQALKGEKVDLAAHLATLRNGNLGKQLRAFIRSGKADCLVGCKVETVSSFVAILHAKVNMAGVARPVGP